MEKGLRFGLLLLASAASACVSARVASAPGTAAPGETLEERLAEFRRVGDYLSPIAALAAEAARPGPLRDRWAQVLAFHLSFVGEYADATRAFFSAWSFPPAIAPAAEDERRFLEAIRPEPAAEALCRRARSHQIVIVNESHHHPETRAFGRQLLDCFREAGFRQLALEALNEPTAELNRRGRVSALSSGYYTVEPQMAGFVGDALGKGFRVVGYDRPAECAGCSAEEEIDRREEAQADALIEEALGEDPSAKLLVWVGYAHAYKRRLDGSPRSRWMAARLWEKAGVEPYTVEQLPDQGAWSDQAPAFSAVNRAMRSNDPVLVDLASVWEKIPESYRASLRKTRDPGLPAVDAIVVHRRRRPSDPRALWLNAPRGHWLRLEVHGGADKPGEPLLVQLFRPGSASGPEGEEDLVPLDQALCREGGECQLVSPPGRYQVRIRSARAPLWRGEVGLSSREARRIELSGRGPGPAPAASAASSSRPRS